MTGLTKRQKDCLEVIASYITAKGYSPSYREISTTLGDKSLGGVYRTVAGLIERGYLIRNAAPGSARNLEIVRMPQMPCQHRCAACGQAVNMPQTPAMVA